MTELEALRRTLAVMNCGPVEIAASAVTPPPPARLSRFQLKPEGLPTCCWTPCPDTITL